MSWPEVKKINSDLNTPLNEGGVKIVKSVQHGSVASLNVNVTISEVNIDKSISFITSTSPTNTNTATYNARCRLVDSTTLQTQIPDNKECWWTVVEFY